MFFNIETGDWDEELLQLFDIPRNMMPDIRSCSEIYAKVADHHLLSGCPVAGMAGDQHAALFGQACFEPGMVKNTYGTGCFMLMNTGPTPMRSQNNLLTTLAWKIGNTTEYALEGSIFVAGAVVQWIRDELQLVRSHQELDALAASVETSNGVFLVPAFTGLGAPHWDPYARGAVFGLTRGANRAHLCRAALESIAFQTADLIQSMERDSGLKLGKLRVDGGACRSNPLMQFQADLLQTEVIRPDCIETTALGAAYFAGLATGFWQDRAAILKHQTIDHPILTTMRRHDHATDAHRLAPGGRTLQTLGAGRVKMTLRSIRLSGQRYHATPHLLIRSLYSGSFGYKQKNLLFHAK